MQKLLDITSINILDLLEIDFGEFRSKWDNLAEYIELANRPTIRNKEKDILPKELFEWDGE